MKIKKNFLQRYFLKCAIVVFVVCVGLVAAKVARQEKDAFVLANDFPRGALVYAQFADLPKLVKRWDESKLKANYLASGNFQEFRHGHLALKLIDRWEDFNSALGSSLDANALSGAADNKSAIALYDIGRLNAVFIAPIASEKIASTIFHQNKNKFEETILSDGTTYYSLSFEADRGRMQQKFLFAAANGRFVLATNETLLLRTLANINGKTKKDCLANEPSFSDLTKIVQPHDATVWVAQSKLNQDLYFKNYWLMSNVDELKNIRAGMFDLEMKEDKWIERREFLTSKQKSQHAISQQEAERLKAILSEDVPFLKLKTIGEDSNEAALMIRKTLFDNLPNNFEYVSERWKSYERYNDDDYVDRYDEQFNYYSSLESEFDEKIDDGYEAGVANLIEKNDEVTESAIDVLQRTIHSSKPLHAVFVSKPQTTKEPFFVEFNRALVMKLQTPNAFSPTAFEQAITALVENQILVQGAKSNLQWATAQEKNSSWRELTLPMLGWKLCYKLKGSDLIVSNNPATIFEITSTEKETVNAKKDISSFEDLTIIRFDQKSSAFDDVMKPLEGNDSNYFFVGNVGSLLDVISDANKIEIRKTQTAKGFREEAEIILKTQK